MGFALKSMILKTKKLKKNITFLKPVNFNSCNNSTEFIEAVKGYISSDASYRNIILDLTGINVLSSIKIGSLVATYHFVEFIYGKIYIVVDNIQAKKMIEVLALNNVNVIHSEDNAYLENIA